MLSNKTEYERDNFISSNFSASSSILKSFAPRGDLWEIEFISEVEGLGMKCWDTNMQVTCHTCQLAISLQNCIATQIGKTNRQV